jgi:tetratricopeptide (TPR) repeat protein
MKFCQSGLELAISIGSNRRHSQALQELAWIKVDTGDFPAAKEYARESQRAAKIAGNLYLEASALYLEAICSQFLGSYSHCISLVERASHLLELGGMAGQSTHSVIRNLKAGVHRCKSEYAEARNIQMQIIHDISADQHPYQHGLALLNIVGIGIETGTSDHDVNSHLEGAHILFHKIGLSYGLVWCDIYKAVLRLRQGKFSAARGLLQIAFSQLGENTEIVAYCLEKLGAVPQCGALDPMSFPWTVTFLVHSLKCHQRLELHKALQFLGNVFQARGDLQSALSLFTIALDGFTQMDVHRSRAECMIQLGDISKLNGDELKAAELWETARPLFEWSSQGRQLADLDVKLAGLSQKQ